MRSILLGSELWMERKLFEESRCSLYMHAHIHHFAVLHIDGEQMFSTCSLAGFLVDRDRAIDREAFNGKENGRLPSSI